MQIRCRFGAPTLVHRSVQTSVHLGADLGAISRFGAKRGAKSAFGKKVHYTTAGSANIASPRVFCAILSALVRLLSV